MLQPCCTARLLAVVLLHQFFRLLLSAFGLDDRDDHETLKHIAVSPCFSRLSDVGDFLGGDAALEIGVTNLKPTRTVREGNGKVTLAVVGVTGFSTFSFCQLQIYSSTL